MLHGFGTNVQACLSCSTTLRLKASLDTALHPSVKMCPCTLDHRLDHSQTTAPLRNEHFFKNAGCSLSHLHSRKSLNNLSDIQERSDLTQHVHVPKSIYQLPKCKFIRFKQSFVKLSIKGPNEQMYSQHSVPCIHSRVHCDRMSVTRRRLHAA